jgi:hypothetical protein
MASVELSGASVSFGNSPENCLFNRSSWYSRFEMRLSYFSTFSPERSRIFSERSSSFQSDNSSKRLARKRMISGPEDGLSCASRIHSSILSGEITRDSNNWQEYDNRVDGEEENLTRFYRIEFIVFQINVICGQCYIIECW